MEKLIIKATVEISNQDIDDVMCVAFDGGITYWARKAEVLGKYLGEYSYQQISRNGGLKIWLIEPFNERHTLSYYLTKSKFLEGLKRYLEDPEKPYNILYEKEGVLKIDTSEVDAVVADMIIQYALFDEIVFA